MKFKAYVQGRRVTVAGRRKECFMVKTGEEKWLQMRYAYRFESTGTTFRWLLFFLIKYKVRPTTIYMGEVRHL